MMAASQAAFTATLCDRSSTRPEELYATKSVSHKADSPLPVCHHYTQARTHAHTHTFVQLSL